MDVPSEHSVETDDDYARLRRAILRGDFQPNERLIELDLAK